MSELTCVDPVNDALLGLELEKFGLMSSYTWRTDPKRLVFTLSRYKFVSKMLQGKKKVLEVGCGDGFGSKIVEGAVGALSLIDVEPLFINDIKQRDKHATAFCHDILEKPVDGNFDGAYSLDVLEHIPPEHEDQFIRNMSASLLPGGALIIGIPSLESQAYASPLSKAGHVNCKSGEDFRAVLTKHFENVFMFSMNDEVVHTGYSPMAHYLFAICCVKKAN
ncbi:MAG: methyltransferase type 12 [Coxiella sp. (in: Bacteria)]|nr:MAG: methyltransferase type 12 [Coxiella sp. (in: g-proteobacteria)]